MGTVASTTARRELPARCLVGRSRSCDLVSRGRDVSSRHALLEWNGADWLVRDLGSRNGTSLDGRRLDVGAQAVVVAGARLVFGREDEAWVLDDAAPPRLMAVEVNADRQRIAEGGYLVLPGPDAPEHAVYRADGAWVTEQQGSVRPVEDREILVLADGVPWRLHLPDAEPGTWQDDPSALALGRLRLQLAYSRDEEYVEAVARCGEQHLDLGARAHHYLLLLLARRRLADQAARMPEGEQGWIRQDELLEMLRTTDNHIYIMIHRARTALAGHGVADAAGLVERRSKTRQLRLGLGQIELRVLDRG